MEKRYSINDEDYSYMELGDVLDALDCDGLLEVGAVYYEADFQPMTITNLMRADLLLEQADEAGYDAVGDCWDNPFLAVGAEARRELQDLLNAWAEKHVDVSGYYEIVGNPRQWTVNADDLPANT